MSLSKEEQNSGGKKIYFTKNKKKVSEVYFLPCASFTLAGSVQSDCQCLRAGRAVVGWWGNSEAAPDCCSRNHQHQSWLTPLQCVQHPWPSTCVLFWQAFQGMTNNRCLTPTHMYTHLLHPHTAKRSAWWHRHKCLHMQESKNSLRSGIKIDRGEK